MSLTHEPLLVAYVGVMSSGRATSLRSVLSQVGEPVPEVVAPGRRYPLCLDGVRVELWVSSMRSWLGTPSGGVTDPRVIAERAQLACSQGVILVVDPHPALIDLSVAALEQLQEDLTSQGRDPSTTPIVVQVNKQDLRGRLPATALRPWLPLGCPFVESVATVDLGTKEALEALLVLLRPR